MSTRGSEVGVRLSVPALRSRTFNNGLRPETSTSCLFHCCSAHRRGSALSEDKGGFVHFPLRALIGLDWRIRNGDVVILGLRRILPFSPSGDAENLLWETQSDVFKFLRQPVTLTAEHRRTP